jgi:LmbE family N-acetylglucosaminyl deacetylase
MGLFLLHTPDIFSDAAPFHESEMTRSMAYSESCGRHDRTPRGVRIGVCVLLLTTAVLAVVAAAPVLPSPAGGIPYASGELMLALEKLRTLGSVLYISAHPDDENTGFLATMSKERHFRTGYLSITRGEGGQNLLGPEQGDILGIIRTQELLGARRIDGAEQFFTRAIDFGYSKSADETLKLWGKEEVLSDVVRIIRTFRPDVIVTRFTPTRGGHGHHTASAVLAYEAFRAAADPTRFPEQLDRLGPWKAKRIVWNVFRFARTGADPPPPGAVSEDLGAYSPLLGMSIGELAGQSRSMHKSQGFGAPENRGTLENWFEHVDGDTARATLFDGIETSWRRVPGGEAIDVLVRDAIGQLDVRDPSGLLPSLLGIRAAISALAPSPWVELKQKEVDEIILASAGLWVDALAAAPEAIPGSTVPLSVTLLNRSSAACELSGIAVPNAVRDATLRRKLERNVPAEVRLSMAIPENQPLSRPYWLEAAPERGRYSVSDSRLLGMPETPPPFYARVQLEFGEQQLTIDVPVRYRWVDPTRGEQYRMLSVVPPVSLSFPAPVIVTPNGQPRSLAIAVRNLTPVATGTVALQLPPGWSSTPASIPFAFDSALAEKSLRFELRPGRRAERGTAAVTAIVGGIRTSFDVVRVEYPHIPVQVLVRPARAEVVPLDIRSRAMSVGYIVGAGDEIPAALGQLGYKVTLLSDEDLEAGDLRRFEVIVAGVRAYNTRERLRRSNGRLLEYVQGGGRYVVQYNTRQQSDAVQFGPYPFKITSDRVSVEDAPVTLTSPKHVLLSKPNAITAADFDGWVQERGLYFAGDWDAAYETPLECHDPGEEPRKGGLIFARHGKGYFVYTGFSFFRQLPSGVPGAYRLFVNLLSQDVGR